MSKNIMWYAKPGTMSGTDDQIRTFSRNFHSPAICIFCGSDNYNRDVQHINELKKFVNEEFPDIPDNEMVICTISYSDSIKMTGKMMLCVTIPIEDFIRLRKDGKIETL